jgi:hypothetical protein
MSEWVSEWMGTLVLHCTCMHTDVPEIHTATCGGEGVSEWGSGKAAALVSVSVTVSVASAISASSENCSITGESNRWRNSGYNRQCMSEGASEWVAEFLWPVKSGKCRECRRSQVWGVRCQMWGVRCQMWGVRCEVWGVRCEVSDVRCEVWGVRCQMWGVRCEMWGVRCEVQINKEMKHITTERWSDEWIKVRESRECVSVFWGGLKFGLTIYINEKKMQIQCSALTAVHCSILL